MTDSSRVAAQRAHANFTENLTPYLTSLLIAGTRYPIPAAVMGFGWLASRVVYTIGCKWRWIIYQCLSQTEASGLLTPGIDGLLTLAVYQTRLLAGPRGALRKLQTPETSPDIPLHSSLHVCHRLELTIV